MRPSILFSILLVGGALLFSFVLVKQKQTLQPTKETNAVSSTPWETKEHTGGNVTVAVSPINLSTDTSPAFSVSFETHSVNLDFDVASVATLSDDTGQTYGTPTWSGSPPGGHHRTGTLSFSSPLPRDATTVTLTLSDIADVPVRTFSWEVRPE